MKRFCWTFTVVEYTFFFCNLLASNPIPFLQTIFAHASSFPNRAELKTNKYAWEYILVESSSFLGYSISKVGLVYRNTTTKAFITFLLTSKLKQTSKLFNVSPHTTFRYPLFIPHSTLPFLSWLNRCEVLFHALQFLLHLGYNGNGWFYLWIKRFHHVHEHTL